MIKYFTVSLDEADESFISALFKRMKLKGKSLPTAEADECVEPIR